MLLSCQDFDGPERCLLEGVLGKIDIAKGTIQGCQHTRTGGSKMRR